MLICFFWSPSLPSQSIRGRRFVNPCRSCLWRTIAWPCWAYQLGTCWCIQWYSMHTSMRWSDSSHFPPFSQRVLGDLGGPTIISVILAPVSCVYSRLYIDMLISQWSPKTWNHWECCGFPSKSFCFLMFSPARSKKWAESRSFAIFSLLCQREFLSWEVMISRQLGAIVAISHCQESHQLALASFHTPGVTLQ